MLKSALVPLVESTLDKVSKVIEPMLSFLVDSISARSCYIAEEHKRSFCPAMSCFAVYHDVPLPHGLPSSIHQGGVLMSRVLMSSTGYLVQTVTPVTGYATDV